MSRSRKIQLAIYAVAVFFMAAHGVNAGIAGMIEEFGAAQAGRVQQVLSLPPLFVVPFALLAGTITSRVSKKRIMLSGLLLVLLGGLMPMALDNLTVILVFRCILGLGVGLLMPICSSVITDYFEGEDRSRVMGYQAAATAAGGVFNGLVGGMLAPLGWRYTFLVYLISIPAFLIVLKFLPDEKPVTLTKKGNTSLTLGVIYVALITFIFTTAKFVFSTNMALFINAESLADGSMAGITSSVYTFAGFVVGFIFGRMNKLFGRNVLALGMLLSGVGLLMLYFAESMVLVMLGAICLGGALSIANPRFNLMVAEATSPQSVALALAICLAANNLGQFASPVIFNQLGVWLGDVSYRFQFMLAAISMGIMAVVSIILNIIRHKRKKPA